MYSKEIIARVMYHIREKKLTRFEISELLGPDVRTIYNWTQLYTISDDTYKAIKAYMKKFEDRPKQKRVNKLTPQIESYIVNYVEKNSNKIINAKKLRKSIRRQFDVHVCIDTIYKWFRKLNITYKKVNKKKILVRKQQVKKVKALMDQIKLVEDPNNIISIDESHFETGMIPAKSWSLKGKKIYNKTYNKTRKNISLLTAISKQKVIGYENVNGSINGQIFLDFIKRIYHDDHVYLMDNARIHHAKILKEYINEKNAKIIYNVPYNPETNPIEHLFSKLKHDVVQQDTKTLSSLKESIDKCIKKTKKKHLENYYKKSLNI